jgi:energy-coupling factor transporter ATP-binding protein EcfA2
MNPDGPFPLLALSSEHGSGKSTLTTLLERIVDPNTTERLAAFKDADALFSTSLSRWIVPYDNLSKISDENSDHLCRLATGGGYTKRQLYTDSDSYSITVKRPIILNGIALTLNRMDLLDRSYLVRLDPIPEEKRYPEEELYAAFEKAHPKILGALLTAVSRTLREKDYKPSPLPRMADAALFIMRAEKGGGLPWRTGIFEKVLVGREIEKRNDALMDDPVASKILALVEYSGWEGSLKSLLHTIHQATDIEERPFLPKLPKKLSRKLEELAPLLRSTGIQYTKKKIKVGQWVSISSERQNSAEATK